MGSEGRDRESGSERERASVDPGVAGQSVQSKMAACTSLSRRHFDVIAVYFEGGHGT